MAPRQMLELREGLINGEGIVGGCLSPCLVGRAVREPPLRVWVRARDGCGFGCGRVGGVR